MRRVYVRQMELKVIDSVYEMPPGEVPVNLPVEHVPDPGYLWVPEEPRRMGPFGKSVLLVVILLVVLAAIVPKSAGAQSNVRQFYGWTDYGGNKGVTINVYPQAPAPPSVPSPPTGDIQCAPQKDGTMLCQQRACGMGPAPNYEWTCQ